jgi:hypothetical protein
MTLPFGREATFVFGQLEASNTKASLHLTSQYSNNALGTQMRRFHSVQTTPLTQRVQVPLEANPEVFQEVWNPFYAVLVLSLCLPTCC